MVQTETVEKPTWERSAWKLWGAVLVAGVIAHLCYGYELDELMHLHTAWEVGQGALPYRDFFENHAPLFHFLLAPFVAHLSVASIPVLLCLRLAATAVAVACLGLCARLVRPAHGYAAVVTVGSLLLIHPFLTVGLEIRPDWLALACVLAALLVASLSNPEHGLPPEATGDEAMPIRAPFGSGLWSGLLVGLAVCMTQKAAFPAIALLAWSVGSVLFAPPTTRGSRVVQLLGLMNGLALPIAALALTYARRHAGALLYENVIRINLHWGQEAPFLSGGQEGILAAVPLFALAYAAIARVGAGLPRHLATRSRESLLASVLLVCTLGFLRTPVPNTQWFLFLIVPWAVCLGAPALCRYATSPDLIQNDLRSLQFGALLCLATLKWQNALIALVVWGLIVRAIHRKLRNEPQGSERIRIALVGALTATLLVSVGRIVYQATSGNAARQADLVRTVESAVRPSQPVLSIWPVLTPFRPSPAYHWFVTNGIYHAVSQSRLEQEYIDSLRHGRTTLAIVRPQDVDEHMPEFARYLHRSCVLLKSVKINLRQVDVYSIPAAPPATTTPSLNGAR